MLHEAASELLRTSPPPHAQALLEEARSHMREDFDPAAAPRPAPAAPEDPRPPLKPRRDLALEHVLSWEAAYRLGRGRT